MPREAYGVAPAWRLANRRPCRRWFRRSPARNHRRRETLLAADAGGSVIATPLPLATRTRWIELTGVPKTCPLAGVVVSATALMTTRGMAAVGWFA